MSVRFVILLLRRSLKMLLVRAVLFVLAIAKSKLIVIPVEEQPLHVNLTTCVNDILTRHKIKEIIYINLNDFNKKPENEDYLLNKINAMQKVTIIRHVTLSQCVNKMSRIYFILARNENEFLNIKLLKKERGWNPYLGFIVVMKYLPKRLNKIFDLLLSLRVYNVVVINGTDTAESYSYDAFENNACGNYYTKIIHYGQCREKATNIYPKMVTSVRGCSFRVATPHLPKRPKFCNHFDNADRLVSVVEQLVFDLISKIMGFKYDKSRRFEYDDYSTIHRNGSVTGPLAILDKNATDIFLGGAYLTASRATKFSFIHGHFDFVDAVWILVKKANELPSWHDTYLEFYPTVWFLLFAMMIVYSILIRLITKSKDLGNVVMILLDNLIQHGQRFKFNRTISAIHICWVWSAYYLHIFYMSSFVGLIAKPNFEYQIQNVDDLHRYDIKPYITNLLAGLGGSDFGGLFDDISIKNTTQLGFFDSIWKVSQSKEIFTAIPGSVFKTYESHFLDEYGQPLIYKFHKPAYKSIYSMYVNKGFPMLERMNNLALRIRGSGIVMKEMNNYYYLMNIKHNHFFKKFQNRVVIPWVLYGCGVLLACAAFATELIVFSLKKKRNVLR